MDIYPFISTELRTNMDFVHSLMELPNLKFHENFESNLFTNIEEGAKSRILHDPNFGYKFI